MPPGRFITFEGIDGSGKSTQARLLAETLRADGHQTILTREPGGSPGAEEIRRLLVEGNPDRWSAETEILLFTAARRDHLEKTIRAGLGGRNNRDLGPVRGFHPRLSGCDAGRSARPCRPPACGNDRPRTGPDLCHRHGPGRGAVARSGAQFRRGPVRGFRRGLSDETAWRVSGAWPAIIRIAAM